MGKKSLQVKNLMSLLSYDIPPPRLDPCTNPSSVIIVDSKDALRPVTESLVMVQPNFIFMIKLLSKAE